MKLHLVYEGDYLLLATSDTIEVQRLLADSSLRSEEIDISLEYEFGVGVVGMDTEPEPQPDEQTARDLYENGDRKWDHGNERFIRKRISAGAWKDATE